MEDFRVTSATFFPFSSNTFVPLYDHPRKRDPVFLTSKKKSDAFSSVTVLEATADGDEPPFRSKMI